MATELPPITIVFEKLRVARGLPSVNSIATDLEIAQSTLQRIQAGDTTTPRNSVVEKLAAYFDVTPAQMRGEEAIDRINFSPRARHKATELPLIGFAQAGGWSAVQAETFQGETVVFPGHFPTGCFAMRSRGDSMLPLFPENYYLAVNPFITAKHGDYVIASLPDHEEATFKKLVIDPPHRILKPLNPEYPPINLKDYPGAFINGVVVRAQVTLREDTADER